MSFYDDFFKPALGVGAGVTEGVFGFMAGSDGAKASLAAGARNAASYDLLAKSSLMDSGENAMRLRKNAVDAVGGARAEVGARGMVNDGSALNGQLTAAARYEQEVNDLAVQGLRSAQGYHEAAEMSRWEAAQVAKAKKKGGLGSVLSSVIKVGATVGGAYFAGPAGAEAAGSLVGK